MTADGLLNAKRADRLMLVSGDRRKADETVYVSRVGREYVYITSSPGGHELPRRFRRATGIEDTNIGWKAALYTPEEYEERQERADIVGDLRGAGIEIRPEARADMSTATLRALLAALQPVTGSGGSTR